MLVYSISVTQELDTIILFAIQAKECLKYALQYHRHDASFTQLGKVYLLEGDTESAIDIFKRAIE